MKKVVIYTDGACKGNPGPGGWGAIMRYRDHEKRLCGGEKETTNNRMELMAAIQALAALTEPCLIDITTDSQYVRKGVTQWLSGWKRNGWLTSAKQPVKNIDLWQRLDAESSVHQVTWHWVKGHSGHKENDIADALANKGIGSL